MLWRCVLSAIAQTHTQVQRMRHATCIMYDEYTCTCSQVPQHRSVGVPVYTKYTVTHYIDIVHILCMYVYMHTFALHMTGIFHVLWVAGNNNAAPSKTCGYSQIVYIRRLCVCVLNYVSLRDSKLASLEPNDRLFRLSHLFVLYTCNI